MFIPPNELGKISNPRFSPLLSSPSSKALHQECEGTVGGRGSEMPKLRFSPNLKQSTDEERSDWKKLSTLLKPEYPKYTPLLAKILEALISQNNVEDKVHHYKEIISAADEVIESIETDELAKSLSLKSDPDDEDAEKKKKKMDTTRDQLADALYQKGLALAEIESLKVLSMEEPYSSDDIDDVRKRWAECFLEVI
ncbi:tripeptidyl-peptidase II Tpp2 [Castilleja foliolosa]|uniref:Tripeptidyl-peptidase II Tpp2 n=1 Tax=Castilleja foliolosa TaxID=1961234 RepID=A0ABD3CM67_9LAMI